MKETNLKKQIIIYKMLSACVSGVAVLGSIAVILLCIQDKVLPYQDLLTLGWYVIVVNTVFRIVVVPFIHVRTYTYELTEQKVSYTSGIFRIKTVVLPMSRIQQVAVTRGALLDHFGLVEVEILTTANTHKLRQISVAEGEKVVERITQLLDTRQESEGMKR